MSDPVSPPPPPSPEGAPPPPPPPADAAMPAAPTKDERNLAVIGHLLGIILSVIGPLIIWLIKKDESPFVDDQGKEAMNFQITALIGWVIIMVLTVVTCGVGGLLAFPYWIAIIVFCVLAAIKSSNGERYRYPATIRLIK